jgi:hypothetical protein
MESKILTQDFSSLDKFVKAITTTMVVRVGIMGNKTTRADLSKPVPNATPGSIRVQGRSYAASSAKTNAEIGFLHEFGVPNKIPKRSFLRMPIFQYAEDIIGQVKKAGALKKLKEGKSIQVLSDLGIACENVIGRAFASAGWGSWAPNAASTIRRKRGGDSPLIDTGQLRRSIASTVTNP